MPANLMQKLRSLDPATTYTGYQAVQRYGITPEEWATAKQNGWVQRERDGWGVNLQNPQKQVTKPAPTTLPQRQQQTPNQVANLDAVRHALEKAPGGSIVTLINGSNTQLPFLTFSGRVAPDGKHFYDVDSNQYPVSAIVSIKDRTGQMIFGGNRKGSRKMRCGMRLSSDYTKVVLSHGNHLTIQQA